MESLSKGRSFESAWALISLRCLGLELEMLNVCDRVLASARKVRRELLPQRLSNRRMVAAEVALVEAVRGHVNE